MEETDLSLADWKEDQKLINRISAAIRSGNVSHAYIIEGDTQTDKEKFEEDPEMEILKGRFGPYISYQKANYRIPKTITDPASLTLEDCKKIIAEAGEKPATKKATRKKKA